MIIVGERYKADNNANSNECFHNKQNNKEESDDKMCQRWDSVNIESAFMKSKYNKRRNQEGVSIIEDEYAIDLTSDHKESLDSENDKEIINKTQMAMDPSFCNIMVEVKKNKSSCKNSEQKDQKHLKSSYDIISKSQTKEHSKRQQIISKMNMNFDENNKNCLKVSNDSHPYQRLDSKPYMSLQNIEIREILNRSAHNRLNSSKI